MRYIAVVVVCAMLISGCSVYHLGSSTKNYAAEQELDSDVITFVCIKSMAEMFPNPHRLNEQVAYWIVAHCERVRRDLTGENRYIKDAIYY